MLRRFLKTLPWIVALAIGAGTRFFWQPKAQTPIGEAVSLETAATAALTQPPSTRAKASQRPIAAAPGAISAELWALLQNRPAHADWARLIESAHKSEMGILFAAWMEADPEAAIRWHLQAAAKAREGPWGSMGSEAVERAFWRDPELAWRIVSETGSLWGCQLLTWNAEALAGKPEVLESMLSSRTMPWLGGELARWLEREKAAPAFQKMAASHPELLARIFWSGSDPGFFKSWSELDPKAAEHILAEATPAQKRRFEAMQRESAIRSDPNHAAAVLQSLPPSVERMRLAVFAAQRLTGDDPAAAFALLEKEAATPTSPVTIDLLQRLAESDLTRAKALAAAAGLRPDDVSGPRSGRPPEVVAVHEMLMTASKSPARLGALLSGEAAGVAKPAAFHHTASRWVVDDPEAASRWVGSLPQGSARDAAIAGMSLSLSGVAPPDDRNYNLTSDSPDERFRTRPGTIDLDGALAWSATISEPETRLGSTLGVIRRMMDADPARARQALDNPSLPPETRAAILAELGLQP